MKAIIIDFETRSECPIAHGVDNYASHESTDILCMAAIELDGDDDQCWLWTPEDGELPKDLIQAIDEADYIMAHNARFDQLIWECVGTYLYNFPLYPLKKWYCTSAQARVNALPASLDDATRCFDSKHRKNAHGKALIDMFSIPPFAHPEMHPEEWNAFLDYCIDDVFATRSLVKFTRLMTAQEHEDWQISERINDRGVEIDMAIARAAVGYADVEKAELAQELHRITDGVVERHTQTKRLLGWILDQLDTNFHEDLIREFTVFKNGEEKQSLDKSVRSSILGKFYDGSLEAPVPVIEAIEIVESNKSSVAKFNSMISRAEADNRVRGAFMYAGASQTIRFSAKGLQPHNMARDCWDEKETEEIRKSLLVGDPLPTTIKKKDETIQISNMDSLSRLLRPTIRAGTDRRFVVGDWSAIEARALPYLAGNAQYRLDAFAEYDNDPSLPDMYERTAEELGLDSRQLGKVAELALGYGGGIGAFNAMGKIYGVYVPEHTAKRIVELWRERNYWAVEFWNKLMTAAERAVKNPGVEFRVNNITYLFAKELMNGTLLCILPDETILSYPQCRFEEQETPFGKKRVLTAMKASFKPKMSDKQWPRMTLWRGLLAENVTQAFCGALLRNALRQLEDVVMHVHDEIILEVPTESAEEAKDRLQAVMETAPIWAEGLPLKAEPHICSRYGK